MSIRWADRLILAGLTWFPSLDSQSALSLAQPCSVFAKRFRRCSQRSGILLRVVTLLALIGQPQTVGLSTVDAVDTQGGGGAGTVSMSRWFHYVFVHTTARVQQLG